MPKYTVIMRKEPDGRFSVTVPALPGCSTWGENVPEGIHMAQEAIELYLEDVMASGEPIPEDI